jgi:hypothetical protein
MWRHRFKSLSLAGLEVANPEVAIIPDKMSAKLNSWSTGTQMDKPTFDKPPMLIGMNVLRHLHVYIAYKEKKLYITPAASAPNPPVTANVPASQNAPASH